MAKLQVVSYSFTCDVCGDTIPDSEGDSATRKVSWEGVDFVVDVCAAHGSELEEVLAQLKGYVDAGNPATRRRGRRPAAAVASSSGKGRRAASSPSGAGPRRGDLGKIRSWARENGHQVSERGRIPSALVAEYDAANGSAAPAASGGRKRGPRKMAAAAAE